ncbi:hypothetical protein M6B38_182645 [Iris pallida]|uniref:Secreted protein n=1 Tax=Iris pallida TaxID=29817 RepID=A0AAX6EKS8_IRIPA|nr:hypothetical protein M6B38_182645 [Iris pallida]
MRRNMAFCWRTLHLARQQSCGLYAAHMRPCGLMRQCGSYAASCGSCGHAVHAVHAAHAVHCGPCGSCGSCDPIFVGFELISLLYLWDLN